MRFKRVFIEITGFCGLECSFCPPKQRDKTKLPIELFSKLSSQLSKLTREISLHVLGDPLTVLNLQDYLDILHKYKLKANITTSGVLIDKHKLLLSTHKAVKQVNFSLNSYNGIKKAINLHGYLNAIFDFCDIVKNLNDRFVNLRLWNGSANKDDRIFFEAIQNAVLAKYSINIQRQKRTRLANRIIFDFDDYFNWPSLISPTHSHSYCLGLIDQLGILSDGTVVPCCLDCSGIINLGNIHDSEIVDILNSNKAKEIIEGFKNSTATEELCKRCDYRLKFGN